MLSAVNTCLPLHSLYFEVIHVARPIVMFLAEWVDNVLYNNVLPFLFLCLFYFRFLNMRVIRNGNFSRNNGLTEIRNEKFSD